MSDPTITDPGDSFVNDPSVVEANDRNLAQAILNLNNADNIVEHYGVKSFGATKLIAKEGCFSSGGNYSRFYDRWDANNFIMFKQFPNESTVKYLDFSAYAQPYSNTLNSPEQLAIRFEYAESFAGPWTTIITLTLKTSADESELISNIKTVDLSGYTYNTSKPFFRVRVQTSYTSYDMSNSDWSKYPFFLTVNVRFKQPSVA